MLDHSDVENRRRELKETINILKTRGYNKTAVQISNLLPILDAETPPSDLTERFDSLFLAFEEDFVSNLPLIPEYGRKCLREIREIIYEKAWKKNNATIYSSLLTEICPLLESLNDVRDVENAISDLIRRSDITTEIGREGIAYLYLFLYQIYCEGIFDNLVRLLFAIHQLLQNRKIVLKDIDEKEFSDIIKTLENDGVQKWSFLRNWDEKRRVRNAIAHARFSYDPAEGYHFENFNVQKYRDTRDKKKSCFWEREMQFEEFRKLALELDYPLQAFYFTFMLLRACELLKVRK